MSSLVFSAALMVSLGTLTAAQPQLPVIKNVTYQADIAPPTAGVPDVDQFEGLLMTGERLSARARAGRRSGFRPTFLLTAPSGHPMPASVAFVRQGAHARVNRAKVGALGLHRVALSGRDGTVGPYDLQFKLSRGRMTGSDVATLTQASPRVSYTFEAMPGATMRLKARWNRKSVPLTILSVTDPNGQPVPGVAAVLTTRQNSLYIKNLVLTGGVGQYTVELERDPTQLGSTVTSVRTTLFTPTRTRATQSIELRAPEPRLDPRTSPMIGFSGARVTFTGKNFSATGGVRVEIGGKVCTVHSVSDSHVDVTVPDGQAGLLTRVTIVNADGQADIQDGYFKYLATAVIPALRAGNGFSGPTPQPAAVGTGPGSSANAIARWDVVPYQTFTGDFHVGVVAFHINGIESVRFSLDGGPWEPVAGMALNPRTGVYEYTVKIDATQLSDGLHEVRAVAYPNAGVARVLAGVIDAATKAKNHSMFLNSNANGTLQETVLWCDAGGGNDTTGDGSSGSPFRTIDGAVRALSSAAAGAPDAGDGATILCRAGDYEWGAAGISTRDRWLTVRAAPGAGTGGARFTSIARNGVPTRLLHMAGMYTVNALTLRANAGERRLWLDGSRFVGPGGGTGADLYFASNWSGIYVTDSVIDGYQDGWTNIRLGRRANCERLTSDAYSGSRALIDCEVNGIDRMSSKAHPDVYQFFAPNFLIDNVVVYGLRANRAKAQGVFAAGGGRLEDIAFVNVLIDMPGGTGFKSQWGLETKHLLMHGVTIPMGSFAWREDLLQDVSIRGSVWGKMTSPDKGRPKPSDSFFVQNHYIDHKSFGSIEPGTGVTVGDPGFKDPAFFDFRPGPGSVLRGRLAKPFTPGDAVGTERPQPAAIGAFE